MRRRKLLWRLYISYLLLVVLSVVAVGWYANRSLRRLYEERTGTELEVHARFVGGSAADMLASPDPEEITRLCRHVRDVTGNRFTVVLPSGQVVGDSDEDPAKMENHADRPEIARALAGETGAETRFSTTLHQRTMYLALPVVRDDQVIGAVRASVPLAAMDRDLRRLYGQVALGGLAVAAAGAVIGLGVYRRISRPLEEMRRGAEAFAKGNLAHRLAVPDAEDLADVTRSLNVMAAQLDDRIRDVTRQRNELEAVLASMVEAVLAVDRDERIIRFNQAAGQLFGVKPEDVQGRSIQEAVRNPELQRFVKETLEASSVGVQGELTLERDGQKFLRAYGSKLTDAQNHDIGALVVLSDVTELKRLESIRRDFVANVSHELKTPITSIKGFVETLLDGTNEDPAETRQFLEIISRHADRLNAIIEDLLSLSRIEQEAERAQIPLQPTQVSTVLAAAIQACASKAEAKRVNVELDCDPALTAQANVALLEQAVVNLIDNAIKYSEPESQVQVQGRSADAEVVVSVIDRGCGIEREHLPRLFERFYRVDKGRSRKLGGTGLGLAIVKHIIKAHHGQVAVESTPGKGSTFSIRVAKA